MHQAIVCRQHEGIDQDARPFALGYFFQGLGNHQRIQSKGVFVNPPELAKKAG
jgi:hypothetical protein